MKVRDAIKLRAMGTCACQGACQGGCPRTPRHTDPVGDAPPPLLVLVFDCYWFEVLGFEDLAAIQAFQVFHAIAPGDDLGTVVLASVLHK